MPDPPSRPPIAPVLPEHTNTVAFNFSKKANLLASLRSKHRSSQTQPTTTTTTTTTKKKGFSSLTTTTTTTPLSTTTPNPHQPQPPQTDDLDSVFRAPPNAGIDYAPPSSSSGTNGTTIAQDAETRVLARKILGRNAARQVQEAREARAGQRGVKRRGGGGVAEESESEEELGRSAVGRARARGGGGNVGGGGVEYQKAGERDGGDGNGLVDVGDVEGKGKSEVVGERAEDVESVPRGDDEEKPKKKKRKKNKGTGVGGGEEA